MRWALFGVPALVLAGTCLGEPAQAFWPLDALTGLLSAPFRAAPYYGYGYYPRYHRSSRHYRHYRHARAHGAHAAPEPVERTGASAGHETEGAIKLGRWEFSAQLAPPAPQGNSGTSPGGNRQEPKSAAGGGLKTTRIGCITSEKAVPIELGPQCKLDSSQRSGANITWSMTCANPRNTVRSDGVAQYRGETMEARMISHLPAGNGAIADITQEITGHYLGPCTTQSAVAAPPPQNSATLPASGGSTGWLEPPARTDAAPQSGATTPTTSRTAITPAAEAAPRRRRHHRWRHRRY